MDWFRKKKRPKKKFAGATLQQDQFNFVFFNPEWKGVNENKDTTSDKNYNQPADKHDCQTSKRSGRRRNSSLKLLTSSHTQVSLLPHTPSYSQQLSATFPQTPNRNNKEQNAFNFSDQILRRIIHSNENTPSDGNKSVFESRDTSDDFRAKRGSSFKRFKNVLRRSFSNFSKRQSKISSQLFNGSFEEENIQHRKSLESFANKEKKKPKKPTIQASQRPSQSLERIEGRSEEEELVSKRVYSVVIEQQKNEKLSKPNRNSLYDNLPLNMKSLQQQHNQLESQPHPSQHTQNLSQKPQTQHLSQQQHKQHCSEYVVFKNDENRHIKFDTQKYMIKKPSEEPFESTFPHHSTQVSPDLFYTQLTKSFDNYFYATKKDFAEHDNNTNDSFLTDTADQSEDNYCFNLMISTEFQPHPSDIINDKDYFKRNIANNLDKKNELFYSQNSFSPSAITPPKLPPKTFRSRSLPKKKKVAESRWSDPPKHHPPKSTHNSFLFRKIDKPFLNSSTPLTSQHVSLIRSPPLHNFAESSFLKCFHLYPKVENVHFDYLPMNSATKLVF